jgi:hypothetical protein
VGFFFARLQQCGETIDLQSLLQQRPKKLFHAGVRTKKHPSEHGSTWVWHSQPKHGIRRPSWRQTDVERTTFEDQFFFANG